MDDGPEGAIMRVGKLGKLVRATAARFDASGWFNAITGLGTPRDKRTAATMEFDPLGPVELENLYRGEAMIARACDLIPSECFRAGFEVRVPDDAGLAQAINSQLDDLKVNYHLEEAGKLANRYGGAICMLGLRGGGRPSEMLDEGRVDHVTHLTHFSSREAWAWDYYSDVGREKYGEVASYQLLPLFGGWIDAGQEILHCTRVLRLDGVPIERQSARAQLGWGDSIIQRIHNAVRDWAAGYGGVAHLLQDAGQGVFKMPELTKLILAGKKDVVLQRMALIDQSRSSLRSMLLSGDESFERQRGEALTGAAQALERLDFHLAATIGFPVTRLLGQAPAGLNATGDADTQAFNAATSAAQVKKYQPPLARLVKLLFRARKGPARGKEPERWSIIWRPLSVPSEKERAEARKIQSEADANYVSMGALSPETVARSRFGGPEFSFETSLGDDEGTPYAVPHEEPEELAEPDTVLSMPAGGIAGGLQAPRVDGADAPQAVAAPAAPGPKGGGRKRGKAKGRRR